MSEEARTRRRYDSPLREAAAAATHQRILDAAAELFGAQGYRSTTIAGIAEGAAVSVPRVNLAGSKAQLLVAAYRGRIGLESGTETLRVTDQPTIVEIMGRPVDDALPAYASWLFDVHRESVGLWFALRTAAENDADARDLFLDVRRKNDEDCAVAVAWARANGIVTGDVDDTVRAQTWGLIGCAETYDRLVVSCGWTREQYVAWVVRAVRTTVCDLAA